ncbi:hypothetical protein QE152_g20781 [Popillia japonica]|uniref:Uncharacterized protein n=1 Tax=Popillia japonica TaxID=7064 RepID=A0AAW1KNE3_POPJA
MSHRTRSSSVGDTAGIQSSEISRLFNVIEKLENKLTNTLGKTRTEPETQTQAKILEVNAKLGEVKGQLSKTEERIDQVEQVTAQQQERMHIEVQYIRKQYEKVGEEINSKNECISRCNTSGNNTRRWEKRSKKN